MDFAERMSDVVQLRPILPTSNQREWVADQTTPFLMRLWNSDWIGDADPGCFVIEAIHAEMNARGRGIDVAI